MLVKDMTHDDIADFGAKRIRTMGYQFSCSNMTSATHGEQPDVLGISAYGESILLEAKVSKSDFLADKKKPWRKNPEMGIGDYRVYLTPKGLLKPEEIPYGWMLWEVHGKNKPMLKVIKGKTKVLKDNPHFGGKQAFWEYVNCDFEEYSHFAEKVNKKNCRKEMSWMWKIMQRAIDDGFEPNNYANKYQTT
jgi:hypothetical protein